VDAQLQRADDASDNTAVLQDILENLFQLIGVMDSQNKEHSRQAGEVARTTQALSGVIHTLRYSSNQVKETATRLQDRKSTRLNSSHVKNSYAVFCLIKKISV